MSKKKGSKLWIIALVLLIVGLSPILIDQQKILFAKDKEMNLVKEKIINETKINEQLQSLKKILNTDEYREKVAREKLKMIKAGERVFVDVNK